MCSIIWSETFIKTNVYKTNQIEKEDNAIREIIQNLKSEAILDITIRTTNFQNTVVLKGKIVCL